MSPQPLILLYSLVGCLLLTACPGSLEDPSRFTGDSGTPTDTGTDEPCPSVIPDFEAFIVTSCGASTCHDESGAANNGLQLADGTELMSGLPDALFNVEATKDGCDLLVVDPNNIDNSLFLHALNPTADQPDGCKLLFQMGDLSDSQKACVKDWISQ